MEKLVKFKPNVIRIAKVDDLVETINTDEPMVMAGSLDYIVKNKIRYPTAYKILLSIINRPFWQNEVVSHADKGYHPVIDTKVVHLKKGQSPCIGGWHCDGVIRPDANSQPDLSTINEDIYHYICTIDTVGNTPTKFIDTSLEMLVDENNVWESVDKNIKLNKLLAVKEMDNSTIYKFNRSTLHKGALATETTIRYFFRLSFYHMPCANKERKQVQIYCDLNAGW